MRVLQFLQETISRIIPFLIHIRLKNQNYMTSTLYVKPCKMICQNISYDTAVKESTKLHKDDDWFTSAFQECWWKVKSPAIMGNENNIWANILKISPRLIWSWDVHLVVHARP